ncbi:hypothetical protein [Rhizobacter sp. OV335]|uniref:hypothetical protein n=1 Tax=Rhizobacter sp. OV335 TaxID=1500264 RepID=UPI0009106D6B|nr:hypothetical protein [Rhizobacter sp. OV335]SHN00323.1 hypothetical protein SAMN02787076_02851 [Rhizobacter sp. OV335]
MADLPRKKSPRAPSVPLGEAIDRALRAYDKQRLQPAPIDAVAQNLGYKGSSSGSALSAMASLRYYGLLERPQDGLLAVTKDVEAFKFAPNDELRRSFLLGFLRRPALFAELLEKYASGLPSDASLKYDLIQRGFLPATASDVANVFRRSAEFSRFFERGGTDSSVGLMSPEVVGEPEAKPLVASMPEVSVIDALVHTALPPAAAQPPEDAGHDRIPVRLSGSRRAWLSIPTPFFAADKQRLKAQIDLLLADDED